MLKNNKNWIILSLISFALVAVSSFVKKRAEVSISVYLGIGFLLLTIIPSNVAKLLPANLKMWPQKLAFFKRDFGITAGLLFLTHALLAWNIFGKLKPEFLLRGEIILGLLALIIFISLLLTSNKWSIRVLKKNWKRLHILVWAAIPLAFFHSSLAAVSFSNEMSPIALIGFGSLYLLAFVQLFFKKWQHFVLVFTAWILSIVIISAFYPQTLADFSDSLQAINSSSSSSTPSSASSSSSVSSQISSSSRSSTASSLSSTVSSLNQISSQESVNSVVSINQLSTNNSASNCWVSFEKKVYNVTGYLNRHPGGRRELLNVCGKEIDNLSNQHPGGSFGSSQIQAILQDFYVGNLS